MYNFVILFVIAFCGSSSSLHVGSASRIIGGSPATDGQFPYMISLQELIQVTNYTRGHRCGGALVTLRHAVTSASCLYNVNLNGVHTLIGRSECRVFAGAAVLNDDYSRDRLRTIANFTVHPDYSPGTPYVNDIAVITLNVEFPSNVVLTVPLSYNDATTSQGPICTSSGWGSQNNTNSPSIQLMHLQKTVLEQAVCQNYYTGADAIGGTALTLQDTMICAWATIFSSSCSGDSGNPLVCNGNLNGILVVNGHDCSNAAYLRPEVYTRVSRFATWINSTIEQTTPTTTTTTTTSTTTTSPAPTPAPGAASTFQPAMAVLVVIAIFQIITANVINLDIL